MKPIYLFLFILTVTSCNKKTREDQSYLDLTVVSDVTDHHLLRPTNSILQLYNFSENKSYGANFRYAEITDLMLSKEINIHLPDEEFTDKKNRNNQAMYREKIIVQFMDSVRKTLVSNNAKADTLTKSNSECFRTIAKQLNALAKSRSMHKLLLAFSNLFEHSTILNVYTGGFKNSLAKHADEIEKIFEKTKLLPDNLTGITVVFVFQPANREEDERYNVLINVYTHMLIIRGAKVILQADNNFYQL